MPERHYNPTISEDAQRILNTKNGQHLPVKLATDLVPVVQIERKTTIFTNVVSDTTGLITVYTARPNRDTYITGMILSWASNALADNTYYQVTAVIKGVTRVIALLTKITLTANSNHVYIQFKNPLKLDRGGAIRHGSVFTVGASQYSTTLYGYEVETTIR